MTGPLPGREGGERGGRLLLPGRGKGDGARRRRRDRRRSAPAASATPSQRVPCEAAMGMRLAATRRRRKAASCGPDGVGTPTSCGETVDKLGAPSFAPRRRCATCSMPRCESAARAEVTSVPSRRTRGQHVLRRFASPPPAPAARSAPTASATPITKSRAPQYRPMAARGAGCSTPAAEDPTAVPPEWHGWLHHTTAAPLPEQKRHRLAEGAPAQPDRHRPGLAPAGPRLRAAASAAAPPATTRPGRRGAEPRHHTAMQEAQPRRGR